MTAGTDRKDLEKLKHLLQDEMSAVESYDKAISHIKHEDTLAVLTELKSGHQARVKILQDKVTELGGELPTKSALWGKVASIVESGVAKLGDKGLVAVLEECEVKSLADYKNGLEVFDEAEHKFFFSDLLPAQQASYEKIHNHHKGMHVDSFGQLDA